MGDAVKSCQLLSLDIIEFQHIVTKHTFIKDLMTSYGRAFHKRVISAVPPNFAWPTDLHVPLTDFSGIVSSMSRSHKVFIGLLAVKHMPWIGTGNRKELQLEITAGRCVLIRDG